MFNNPLFKLVIAPAIVLILHVLATVLDWYDACWWLDKPLHFLGGVAIAISSYFLLGYFTEQKKLQITWSVLTLLLISSMIALAAVSWEFLEFYIDSTVYVVMQPSVKDTITDLLMGMSGGMLTATLLLYGKKVIKKSR